MQAIKKPLNKNNSIAVRRSNSKPYDSFARHVSELYDTTIPDGYRYLIKISNKNFDGRQTFKLDHKSLMTPLPGTYLSFMVPQFQMGIGN